MQQRLELKDGSLFYVVSGSGPPIVFVSGLGGHAAYWAAQTAALSSSFQTVAFDHRGVGRSQGAPPYSVEQWADDTIALMDHLGLRRVCLVGHSTGGAIAQVVAAQNPERVGALVLSGTWARADARFRQLFMFRKQVLREMGQSAYEELGEALTIEACLPLREFHPPRSPSTNDPSANVVAARIDALLAYDAGERLRQIRCPTLVVAAADDILVPRQLSEVLSREIAGARLAVLDSGGHHFPRTRAEAYGTLLSDFLRTALKEEACGE